MTSSSELPARMKALVLTSTSEPPTIQTVPTPLPDIGSAVIRILAANVISYMRDIYNGKRGYPFPTPLIPGTSAIARVAAVGSDATKLKPGDLVFFDNTIRSRDEPSHVFLSAIIQGATAGSAKLMRDVYRNGSYAEYCRAPLESLYLFDERRLTGDPCDGGLGYKIEELGSICGILVPYGGLRDIELRAGQTFIVAPATGPFGGWAVAVALAMGARVITMGRNKASLETLKKKVPMPERVETVPITDDLVVDADALKQHGQIDAYFDIGPPEASGSTHIKSCIIALRHGAKISFMGGYNEDIAIPHRFIMQNNMRIYGKWMYERSDINDLFKLIENGLLKLGSAGGFEVTGIYPLEQWKEAWDDAAENALYGQITLIKS
ncbi:hypothetical protein LTR49_026875 [Elasticomyces elasticus]|nr:hypothetical protein LTR49_026875 [Elasticomyces elasticus]